VIKVINKIAVLGVVTLMLAAFSACGEEKVRELILLTNDSFDISEEIIAEFEAANDATVVIVKAGSSGEVLVRAILEKDNPSADLIYGIDNTSLTRALDQGILVKYVDYGYVNLNYDKAFLEENGLEPPSSLEELTGADWKGRLVVQNPGTSSPGLAFLIATVSYFGEDDDYDYLDFWADLRANGVAVKDDWSSAYYTDFSHYGGDRPLVVSYATSPAAEVFFSEGKYDVPPTGNVLVDKATFLQIEGIAILKGARNIKLAQKFIDFALDKRFQEDIPGRMFVYPVNREAALPDFFKFSEVPTEPADIGPETIDQKRDTWIDAWTKVVIR